VRYFTCTCKGPKHGKLTGCSGTGADFTDGLCAWCIAECGQTGGSISVHRWRASTGPDLVSGGVPPESNKSGGPDVEGG
jgi:hypothetical protein